MAGTGGGGGLPTPIASVAIELLKEAGHSIRASWDLVNNLIKSFLYFNLILFTIYAASTRGFGDIHLVSNAPAATPAIGSVVSIGVSILGILGVVIAWVLLNMILNHGRKFLEAADIIEDRILNIIDWNSGEVGFYPAMRQRYESAQDKSFNLKHGAVIVFLFLAGHGFFC